ncbi:hypothetical protein EY643_19410 [Halioglobus maricola]|uniref:Uncharacterized protein n=1 Tax=Halioglobus maricola TaxID=2601894 RepID=A0A5P9NQA5_9GAMM|nr:hypothetical protein [Halioglobus maricola]QFU77666.1 hypothetical protein EY643_19410 [Halioglobus maricola]
MDLLKTLLITFLLMPALALADERTKDETVYMLAVADYEGYPDPVVGCEWAAPYLFAEPIGGAVANIYTTVTDPETGIVSPGDTVVGELWVCVDEGGEFVGPGTRVGYSQGEAYFIDLGGVQMGALGTVETATPYGFPEDLPGTYVFATSAAVVLLEDGVPGEPIGALASTYLQVPRSQADYPPVNYMSLRLYTPRDLVQEAAEEALESAVENWGWDN